MHVLRKTIIKHGGAYKVNIEVSDKVYLALTKNPARDPLNYLHLCCRNGYHFHSPHSKPTKATTMENQIPNSQSFERDFQILLEQINFATDSKTNMNQESVPEVETTSANSGFHLFFIFLKLSYNYKDWKILLLLLWNYSSYFRRFLPGHPFNQSGK